MVGMLPHCRSGETKAQGRPGTSEVTLVSESCFPWENTGVGRMASFSPWNVKKKGQWQIWGQPWFKRIMPGQGQRVSWPHGWGCASRVELGGTWTSELRPTEDGAERNSLGVASVLFCWLWGPELAQLQISTIQPGKWRCRVSLATGLTAWDNGHVFRHCLFQPGYTPG